MIQYSFIVPVYNRPQEIQELLESMTAVHFPRDFEIVIVEDGSTVSSEKVVKEFEHILNISYYKKENSGPGASRNYGMQRAKGNYFIILDSDCLIPSNYLQAADAFLKSNFVHCYGGPDAAHESFSPLQKAINYTMTSFFTTGGIRGGKKQLQRFEPRSFNMGISKEAFIKTGGFGKIHPGEDPDLSQRLLKSGYETAFIPDAYVYHKRRISWKKFYQQVRKFGLVRPILNKRHPSSAKITFWFPSLFVIGVFVTLILSVLIHWYFLIPLGLYLVMILIDASWKNKSIRIGIYSLFAVFIQFFGYGIAFLQSYWNIHVLNKDAAKAFPFLFFD
jgi:glycosyltransferase involved in cell wall biosynthesis